MRRATFHADHDQWLSDEPQRHAQWLEEQQDPYNGHYDRVSTSAALQEGAKNWSEFEVLRYLRGPEVRRNADKIGGFLMWGGRPLRPHCANFKPHLEIAALVEQDLVHPHEARAAALRWPVWTRGITEYVLMRAIGNGAGEAEIFLWRVLGGTFGPDEGRGQILRAVYSKNSWTFRCPVTGRRARTLYLRDGFFASLEGNNLEWEHEVYVPRPEPKFRRRR